MELFYCNIAEFMDIDAAHLLTHERRAQMERCIRQKDRAACLAGGVLMRAVLGKNYHEHLYFGKHGKPELKNGPFFNLSHSGDYVALCVSSAKIGVDIEKIGKTPKKVATRYFTEAENAWLLGRGEAAAFYKIWTAKESVMKATGLGFTLHPASFEVLPIIDGEHIINGKAWFLSFLKIDGHQVCICSESVEPLVLKAVGRAELFI
ncbi:MAG: 4'-phosphopantetheinyl transferase superfamily protein [Clostridia bacterium]|nr:4'-phosphopantetheinyl transferase superfamily protein [Clostridia bacterium]